AVRMPLRMHLRPTPQFAAVEPIRMVRRGGQTPDGRTHYTQCRVPAPIMRGVDVLPCDREGGPGPEWFRLLVNRALSSSAESGQTASPSGRRATPLPSLAPARR